MPRLTPLMATAVAAFTIATSLTTRLEAQSARPVSAKKALDHSAYGYWNRIAGSALSSDGRWASYTVAADSTDSMLHVVPLTGSGTRTVERGTGAVFTRDGRFVAFRISPQQAAVKQAKKDKKKPDQMPQDSVGIMDVASGTIVRYARVKSFKTPAKASNVVAILFSKSDAKPDSIKSDSTKSPAAAPGAVGEKKAEPGRMPEPNPVSSGAANVQASSAADAKPKEKEKKRDEGTELVLRVLATGEERRIQDVVTYDLSEDGSRLVYVAGNKSGSADGIYVMNVATGQVTALVGSPGTELEFAL